MGGGVRRRRRRRREKEKKEKQQQQQQYIPGTIIGHHHLVHLESERDLDVPHGPKARAINHHHPHHSTTHTRAFPIISTPMKRVVGLVLVMSSTRIVVVLL